LLRQHLDLETRPYDDFVSLSDIVPSSASALTNLPSAHSVLPPPGSGKVIYDPAPWPNAACKAWKAPPEYFHPPLYTPEQRLIRDKSPWTMVQAVLAPLQFLIFLVSLGLVGRYLATGQGYDIATYSIVAKTIALYVIMITGSIWEKVVFDEWLFADGFFWEDVFSMLVLGLQSLYLGALVFGWWSPNTQIMIALAAYATYVINATQFVWKLRIARLEAAKSTKLAEASS
jgi:3-vinyl bacteriochlorophyllide hydratase